VAESERNPVRLIVALGIAGVLLFFLALYFTIRKHEASFNDAPDTSTFSTSAIGHSALFALLKDLNISTDTYRYTLGSGSQSLYGNLAVMAEPSGPGALNTALTTLKNVGAILMVVPKRRPEGIPDGSFLRSTALMTVVDAERVVQEIVKDARVIRPAEPQPFDTNTLGVTPEIKQLQLLTNTKLKPVVASKDGILLGETRRGRAKVWVLSDPDIIANHGLLDGQNALFAIRIIEALLPKGQRVIFDETIHGFSLPPTLWLAMFRPPWIAVTLAFAFVCAILGFAALNRFGRPRRDPDALQAGKYLLIDNTAELLAARSSPPWIAAEFVRAVMADTARRLRLLRSGQSEADLVAALAKAERGRKVSRPITQIADGAAHLPKQGLALATIQAIDRWRKEVLHDAR
jgi:hypothetical protein